MKLIKNTTALAGITGIGLGAFGAHALRDRLTASGKMEVWQTAVLYHLVHAVALLVVFTAAQSASEGGARSMRRWNRIGLCWGLGIVLFSGSLYALALGGPSWLGPITPLGGVAFIVGWFLVAFVQRHPHP